MKIKNAIFNVLVYSMLGWTILSATYVSLPPDIQALVPQFNWLTAVISGGATGVMGIAGVSLKAFINKAQGESDTKYKLLAHEYLQVVEEYKAMKNELTATKQEIARTNESVARVSNLLEVDLKAKLSNPLIDKTVKEMIEGVVNGEQE